MRHTMRGRLKLGQVLGDAVLTYFRRLPVFLGILMVPVVVGAATFLVVGWQVLGFSAEGAAYDPSTLDVTLNRDQRVMLLAAALMLAVVASMAMAASVHAACERLSLRRTFSSVSAKPMQLFWLQVVIYVVALRLSPFTVPLLWFAVAFGLPVALREDLGPSAAMDRAWVLSEGSRAKLLVLEVLLLLPVAAFVLGITLLFVVPVPWFSFNSVAPQNRMYFSIPITALMLIPVQFMFVALARAYEMLRQGLHDPAASSVSPS